MIQALDRLPDAPSFNVQVIDVDEDPDLVALYDELVPVLVGYKGDCAAPVQLCHYFLDQDRVLDFLQGK